ncbi:MAG: hypothetical protein ACQKBU_12090 [Verrucomicrobiales bacterium]
MRIWKCSLALAAVMASAVMQAQVVAPPVVVDSAIEAVEDLGRKVVLGEHRVAIDKMYPLWKKRMAKRKGGLEQLERDMEGIGAMMARNGVSLISFKSFGQPAVHEVWPGEGSTEMAPVYTKWMLLIPTVIQLRFMDKTQEVPRVRTINSYGFQVAIADKDKLDWTFINGSDVTVADLRGLFTSLPADLRLPPVRREEVQ